MGRHRVLRVQGRFLPLLLGAAAGVLLVVVAAVFLVVAAVAVGVLLLGGTAYVAVRGPLPLARHAGQGLLLGGVALVGVGMWLPSTLAVAAGVVALALGVVPWLRRDREADGAAHDLERRLRG